EVEDECGGEGLVLPRPIPPAPGRVFGKAPGAADEEASLVLHAGEGGESQVAGLLNRVLVRGRPAVLVEHSGEGGDRGGGGERVAFGTTGEAAVGPLQVQEDAQGGAAEPRRAVGELDDAPEGQSGGGGTVGEPGLQGQR